MTETLMRGATWKLAPCPGCGKRRMMPQENTLCLSCVEAGIGTRRAKRRGGRSPSVEVPALCLLREARGLTVSELARLSNVDYTTVMRLEGRAETANPQKAQAATAEKLARALSVGVEELAGCRGGPSTNVCGGFGVSERVRR